MKSCTCRLCGVKYGPPAPGQSKFSSCYSSVPYTQRTFFWKSIVFCVGSPFSFCIVDTGNHSQKKGIPSAWFPSNSYEQAREFIRIRIRSWQEKLQDQKAQARKIFRPELRISLFCDVPLCQARVLWFYRVFLCGNRKTTLNYEQRRSFVLCEVVLHRKWFSPEKQK